MNDIERQLKELGERAAEQVTYREVPRARIVRRARMRRTFTIAAPVVAATLLVAIVYPRVDLGTGEARSSVNLAAAAAATQSAGTARFEFDVEMGFSGRTSASRARGEVDFDSRRSYLRVVTSGIADVPEAELIIDGRTVFQRVVGGDAKWYKTRVDMGRASGPFASSDPSEFFGYLESVSKDITDLGQEELDGVTVTHLRAVLDMDALRSGGFPATFDIRYEPMDVWIDAENRLRQMTSAASSDGMDMRFTLRFSDFGVPVDIALPSSEDITDEPPEWPGTELIEEEVGPGVVGEEPGGLDEFGIEETAFLTGPEGIHGPNVLLAFAGDSPVMSCVHSLPGDATSAAIVHESSGRSVVTIGAGGLRPTGDTGVSGGCPGSIAKEDADALLADPSRYVLRIATGDGVTELPLQLAE